MIRRNVSVPELVLIAGTRVMAGAGIGLLLADRFKPQQKRAVGWTLLAVGVLTTFPLVADVLFGEALSSPMSSNQEDDKLLRERDMSSSHV